MRRLRISENKWKYFSFILIAVIAVGITAPRSFADSTSSILYIVTNIQKTLLPNLQATVDSIKTATTDNLDAKVSSRADGSLYNSARASKLDNLDNLDAKMSDVIQDGFDVDNLATLDDFSRRTSLRLACDVRT